MYSKLLSTLLGRHKSQCKSQPGPASETTTTSDSHLAADGGGGGPTTTAVKPPIKPHPLPAAGHALLLDDCQLIDHAPCPRCSQTDNNYEVVNMRHFALSWNVKYLGSFPISNTTPEHVTTRLEKFQAPPISKWVTLSVSLLGVRVHSHDTDVSVACGDDDGVADDNGDDSDGSSASDDVDTTAGVAYTALEASGQTYRRQCHVFQTDVIHQVEEIESVLGNAFQAAIVAKTRPPSRPISMSTPLPVSSVDSPPRKDLRREEAVAKICSLVPEEPPIPNKNKPPPAEPKLVYDEKLGEWIYPVDDALQAQLENVNYFVKLPSRSSEWKNEQREISAVDKEEIVRTSWWHDCSSRRRIRSMGARRITIKEDIT
ncbi:unnamed protein product [Angiostrongylus costaricensis]|uniref:PID domain-containing protein n=1 Tax=Angiostrongylus costaricensis TaxID=334426 RepID=A0A158PEL6_ANGCS|nr:unnamed protein product [Angiostrongylus costaricensis]